MPAPLAMAGPIGLGVASTVARARRARRPRARAAPPSAGRSWTAFVVIAALLSWLTAALVPPPAQAGLLDGALWYATVMGWQPLVAAWLVHAARGGDTDTGVRGAPLTELVMAVGLALGCAVAAAGLALLAGESSGPGSGAPPGRAMAGAVAGALVVLWLQAATEEYGWRGAPLAWATRAFGPRRGLVVHGAVWGLWYAPLFLRPGGLDREAAAAAAGFVATCAALGVVLGWLRLRSRSLAPPVVANLVLTLAAGVPLVVDGDAAGVRDAVLRWPGWPVLAALAAVVLVWRRRELDGRG